MRQLVDDVLASGGEAHLAAEVDHRASILPLVMSGLGHAVMPSAWSSIALPMGAQVHRIEPACVLRIFSVWRQESLTPGATAFLDVLTGHAGSAASAATDADTKSTSP
jgi:DNA-binding transcriptional LysR family regulator